MSVAARAAKPSAQPRLLLSVADAAAVLSMSPDHFERHVLHELRIVRSGRKRLVPVRELERWIDRNAARALD